MSRDFFRLAGALCAFFRFLGLYRAKFQRFQKLERKQELSNPPRRTCLTPWIAEQAKNQEFCIQSTYVQLDGGQIIVEEFPYDGSRERPTAPRT